MAKYQLVATPQMEKKEGRVVEPGSELTELRDVLIAANRIGNSLQSAAADQNVGLTISDWLLLHLLASEGPLTMTKAASKIGVSRQWVHQQAWPLQTAGAITIGTAEDGKSKTLSIQEEGNRMISRLDSAFLKALTEHDGSAPTMPIHFARKSTSRVARMLTSKKASAKELEE